METPYIPTCLSLSMQCPTNAQSLGSNVGSNTKPIKIVNGQAVAVTNDLMTLDTAQTITGRKTWYADNYSQGPVIKSGRTTVNQNIGGLSYLDGSDKETCQNWVSINRSYTTLLRNENNQESKFIQSIDSSGAGSLSLTDVNGTQNVMKMEVVNIANYPAAIEITGIGTKLANCKYCILDWHDSRFASMHISTILTGQSGGYSYNSALAIYEFNQEITPYSIGVRVLNSSANKIEVMAKAVNLSTGVWSSYLSLMIIEKITFIYA